MMRLCDFDHIMRNAAVKIFLEKKSELREVMNYILKQQSGIFSTDDPAKVFEYADRLKEILGPKKIDLEKHEKKLAAVGVKLQRYRQAQ